MHKRVLFAIALGLLAPASQVLAQNLLTKPDFGTTAAPAAAPGDFKTGFTLYTRTDGASTNGSYQVTATPANFRATATGGDHTVGAAPGVFMTVDGSGTATTKVWQQVVGVQPGRTYTFSYWQRNLLATDASPAVVQLRYQGSSASAETAATPAASTGGTLTSAPAFTVSSTTYGAAWQQVTYNVTTGASDNQLTLTLYDLNTASGGNNFGLDDFALTLQAAGGIGGTVFEDLNYGGGAGRTLDAATTSASSSGFTTGVGRPSARVELYNTATGAFVGSTLTDTNGYYYFPTVAVGTGYTVRVVSSTVSSGRTGYASTLLPIVTLSGKVTDLVGGPNPALPDAPANDGTATLAALTTTAQAVEATAALTVSTTAASNMGFDFGFNFDLVVNTNVSGQGSLGQFILNANALGNEAKLGQAGTYLNQVIGASNPNPALPAATESSIFMLPDGQAHGGLRANSNGGPASQLSSGVATIAITGAALPAITGPYTVLNAWTQSANVGNTNDVALGTGGTVGAANAVLPQLNGPEVQLTGTTATGLGLDVKSNNAGVIGLAIYGFGNSITSDNNTNIRVSGSSVTLQGNVIGTTASSFSKPGTPSNSDGVRATGGSGLQVLNNLIGFHNGSGLVVKTAATGAVLTGNEVQGNNLTTNRTLSGVVMQGSGATLSNNLVANNAGTGFDSQEGGTGSTGTNVWSGNTVSGNGLGWSGNNPVNQAGIRLYGSSNTVSQNLIAGNYGAGVLATSAATQATISQNSIYGNGNVAAVNKKAANGQLGIDLTIAGDDQTAGTTPYVTTNSTSTAGANSLINYPVLSSAVLTVTSSGPVLTVTGTTTSGYTVELFIAQANTGSNTTGNGYGQGSSFIYSAVPNANSFTFTIPLNGLTASQRAALTTPGSKLTSTATLASLGTSEFSANLAVNSQPAAFDVSNLRVATGATAAVLNPNLTVPQAANDAMYSITSFTVNKPTAGTLYYNGTAVTGATTVLVGNVKLLTYQPPTTAGTYSFTFTATSNNPDTNSNTTSAATYSLPVVTSGSSFVANDDGLDAPAGMATAGNVVLNDGTNNSTNFTATKTSNPSHGTVTLNTDGSYTYTPTNGYTGPDSFTYTLCTTGANSTCSNTATVAINVYDPNRVCSAATGPNLLQNPGFEAGNTSFTSNYTFVARPSTAATSSPNGLYPESKYAVDADAHYYHGNFNGLGRGGSGNFMIVNGAADQSQVYSQVVNVTANRYYTFSGYAQSINAVSPATLGFVINGKSASVATTLSTTTQQYQQFSGVWYSGSNNTATFEVRDINRDAGGNDFGLDDLYFGTCNVDMQAVNITNSPGIAQNSAANIAQLDATLSAGSSVTVASFVMQTVPSFGTLLLGGPGGTVVVAGQVIPFAQRNTLYYRPSGTSGTATFTYTAVDSEGSGSSNIATYQIPVNAGPLPVQLTAFTARAAGQGAQLDWTTASELHNRYFAVERSTSGLPASFTAIGQVAGQGTKETATSYTFTDRNAAAMGQVVYYRLRQVDADGTSTYSPVRAVSFAPAGSLPLSVYPNPTAGPGTSLDLSGLPASATYQVRLLDATGRQVRQWELPGGQAQPLGVADLGAGTYLLLVTGRQADGSALRQVLHLTKE